MIPRRASLLLLAVLVILTGLSAVPGQQGSNSLYFADSGQGISGEFYNFWMSTPEPMTLYGYPITGVLPHLQKQGVQVQYFQRARMEYDPTQPAGKQITLAPLGEWFYELEAGQPADFNTSGGVCDTIADPAGVDRLVCYAFQQFYNRYQGEKYLGVPISNAEWVEGRLVQYFQRARMEWRPEQPAGQRVVLTELGRLDLFVSRGMQIPGGSSSVPGRNPLTIELFAFVEHPLLASGEQQRVYIIVRDQLGNPQKDIQVSMTVKNGENNIAVPGVPLTNEDGLTQAAFTIDDVLPNQLITIKVETLPSATVEGKASTTTWFRIWW